MKEYSDGNTDIRRITLKRKNVGRHCGESFKDRMPDSSGQEFFATDYFDVMSVERKSSADDFTDIMGVCAEDAVVDDEVSVQSFVLYENGIRCLTEYPFDVSDEEKKKAPFLSIIQVHITPEILGNLEVTGMEAIFLFRQDLETAVSDYCRQCLDTDPFTYGIYQLLSAGDFAVVVRSRQAKTAFSVSTLIRRRSVCVKENGLSLVLYKTYTILTIDGCIIDVFPDAEAAKGQFVLRGCYSNLYWSKKDEIKETIIRNYILKRRNRIFLILWTTVSGFQYILSTAMPAISETITFRPFRRRTITLNQRSVWRKYLSAMASSLNSLWIFILAAGFRGMREERLLTSIFLSSFPDFTKKKYL